MPFGLKNAPLEFQKTMNDIFNDFQNFTIVYVYDVLIFFPNLEKHFKYINIFFIDIIKRNGLVYQKSNYLRQK